jgi:hypothetical protein
MLKKRQTVVFGECSNSSKIVLTKEQVHSLPLSKKKLEELGDSDVFGKVL